MSYWDTSAFAKLYLTEADSVAFEQKAATVTVIVTVRLALYEMRRVAFRKESDGIIPAGTAESILAQVEQDVGAGEVRVVEVDAAVEAEFNNIMVTCYRRTPSLPIRTFDALHLASARVVGETELVATDKRMRDAAKLLGFSLFPT